jgi:FKBP-type peptidyl-prolyl cis-trans isomerase FklB
MRSVFLVVAGVLLLTGQVFGAEEALFKNQRDKVSYTIGYLSGNSLKKQDIDVDLNIFTLGVKDALSGGKTILTNQEMQDVMMAFSRDMAIKQADKQFALGEKNKKEGEAFLAENRGKEGVITLPSGLQYKVLKEGTGKSPKSKDEVVVHYRGTRIDGTEFDSSYQRNEPATLTLDQVIMGWTEALMLMKEGAKWQLFIPSELAYGKNGAGAAIEPNSVLIFDVELISVKKGTAATPPAQLEQKASKPEKKASKPTTKTLKPAKKS